MTKSEIDTKYQEQVKALEAEFFDFLAGRRTLKPSKLQGDFDGQQSALSRAHEAELLVAGFMQPRPPEPPVVDWKALWEAADTLLKVKSVLAQRLGWR